MNTKQMQKKTTDMTEGNVLRLIISFAGPILLGNLFQEFYGVVDTVLAGRFLGDQALAAIGATSAISSMILSLANGMNNGYAIILARAFGEKDYEKVKNSVALMLFLNLIVTLLLTAFSLFFLRGILQLIHTPQEIMQQAYAYIQVILAGLIVTIFYNMEAAILRAVGNSRTPLIFLILASILNVIMDILFVAGLKTGIEGLAYATVIAQAISIVCCLIHIKKHYPILHIELQNFRFDRDSLWEMFSTGLSMGLMMSIFNIGTLIMQGAINALGAATITAHHAARKIDVICMHPMGALAMANATFVGQNFGAGKIERVKEGIKKTCVMGFLISLLMMLLVMPFADVLVKLLTETEDLYIIKIAAQYLRMNLPFFFSLVVLQTLRTSLQGLGSKISPLISSSMELILKVIAAFFVIPAFGYLAVCLIEPITWVVCMLWLIGSYRVALNHLERKKEESVTQSNLEDKK